MLKVNNLVGFWAGIIDPYKNNVVAQSNLRFANGTTSYSDDTGKGVSLINGAQIDSQAIKVDGANDYARFGTNLTDFDFGSGDFTIELFVLPEADATFQWLGSLRPNSETGGVNLFGFGFYSDGDTYFAIGASSLRSATSFSPYDGNVHHIAYSRKSGTLYLAADGIILDSGALAGAIGTTSNRRLKFGVDLISGGNAYIYSYKGSILSYRITKGVGRYTSDYQVPNVGNYKFPEI